MQVDDDRKTKLATDVDGLDLRQRSDTSLEAIKTRQTHDVGVLALHVGLVFEDIHRPIPDRQPHAVEPSGLDLQEVIACDEGPGLARRQAKTALIFSIE